MAIFDVKAEETVSNHVFTSLACRLMQAWEPLDWPLHFCQTSVKVFVNEQILWLITTGTCVSLMTDVALVTIVLRVNIG